ncbi:Lysophospholipid acyltransferase 1 [Tupaia chinensis]|uniref:Lysophospholipid acyltransferase 1 n=1 Tax=Tupaia chinensis TaxID=246437 RepID=L9L123_TUPCH|nr:Lysophospholipid acyltransferase 1 [Tupaia chinensis]
MPTTWCSSLKAICTIRIPLKTPRVSEMVLENCTLTWERMGPPSSSPCGEWQCQSAVLDPHGRTKTAQLAGHLVTSPTHRERINSAFGIPIYNDGLHQMAERLMAVQGSQNPRLPSCCAAYAAAGPSTHGPPDTSCPSGSLPAARPRGVLPGTALTLTASYSIHLFVLVLMCYGIMVTASVSNVHRYSFFVAMGYLTICHISRIYIFNYGILTTDFSGAKPSFLEYVSYLLNFMSVIAGPCNHFKDYVAFIEGRHIHMKLLEVNWKQKGVPGGPEPSPTGAVIRKLCLTLVSLLLFLTLTKAFPVTCLVDDWFVHRAHFLTRLYYLFMVMQASKPKYYFAWTLADAVNNAAGFGFSGVDENGNFCWDLLSNLNIWKIETATSFKMYLENWNIQTAAWLKCVCYERASWNPTVLTFILSALWHGVYPGYYFTFLTGILVTSAARAVRNNCRHYFLSSKALKAAYDVATWVATQLAMSYTGAPFVMLAVEPVVTLYTSMYFYLHIISLLIILFLPMKPQARTQRRPETLNSVSKTKTD